MILFKKIGEVLEKTSQRAAKNLTPTLQSSQSQTPQLVTDSDKSVEIFSEMNHSKKFFKVIRDLEGNFSWNGHDIVPIRVNRVRINHEDYDLTPEIQTAFTDTRYNSNNKDMDDESVLAFLES